MNSQQAKTMRLLRWGAAGAVLIAKGRTPLPRWMWVLNPLTFKILLNAVGRLGTNAILNGLACSNMSLGALLIFAAWMAVLRRQKP